MAHYEYLIRRMREKLEFTPWRCNDADVAELVEALESLGRHADETNRMLAEEFHESAEHSKNMAGLVLKGLLSGALPAPRSR